MPVELPGYPKLSFSTMEWSAQLAPAKRWYVDGSGALPEFVCGTRDVFSARLDSMVRALMKTAPAGLSENLPLLAAVIGEIGNNSFDHNLGRWPGAAGCWLQYQTVTDGIWAVVADRGVGIRTSLQRVAPELTSDQAAVDMAFTRVISGRHPERRGNGLKFVRASVSSGPGIGLYLRSGRGQAAFGERGIDLGQAITQIPPHWNGETGTFALIFWGLAR